MSLLNILKFPDPKLRRMCDPVKEVTPELTQYSQDMLETMYSFKGIGLAAAQVDRTIRLLVVDTRPKEDGRYVQEGQTDLEKTIEQPLVLFNPEIIGKKGLTTYDEGCLSLPSYYETVERYDYIEVKALNEKNEEFIIKTDGLLSICIQHEIDHLDGKLFIDRLSMVKANKIKKKIKKFGYPEMADDKETDEESEA